MANPVMAKSCLLKIIITLAIIVILVVAAYFIVSNLTLEQLGLADTEFGGTTIRELGLHDIKIKEFVKIMKNIAKPDEAAILDNQPDKDDQTTAKSKTIAVGIDVKSDGTPDYVSLLTGEPIKGETQKQVKLTDREIAAIFSAMVEQAGEDADEDLKTVKELNAKVAQITITKSEGVATVEVLLYMDISSLSEKLSVLGKLIPSKIYLNCVNVMQINTSGEITMVSRGLEINGMSDDYVAKVVNAIYKKVIEGRELTEEQKSKTPEQFINESVGATFVKTVNNIGLVGTATVNPSGAVDVATISYGNNGVYTETTDGLTKTYVSLITRKG